MLEFRDITIEDKDWMQPLYEASGYGAADYNFTLTYMWREALNFKVAKVEGFMVQKSMGDAPYYLYPVGVGDVKPIIEALLMDAKTCGHDFQFYTVLEHQCQQLEELFPEMFDFEPLPDCGDYIYATEDLMRLKGKKYHGKRNHISRFKREYPEWRYEAITPENLPEVIAMGKVWCAENPLSSKSLEQECRILTDVLGNMFHLGLDGGLIRVNGKIVAFSLGEKLTTDTYLIHVEKAFTSYEGSYAMINQQFAAHQASGFAYINREDDAGDERLRQSKLSYHPVKRVEKYRAFLKEKTD